MGCFSIQIVGLHRVSVTRCAQAPTKILNQGDDQNRPMRKPSTGFLFHIENERSQPLVVLSVQAHRDHMVTPRAGFRLLVSINAAEDALPLARSVVVEVLSQRSLKYRSLLSGAASLGLDPTDVSAQPAIVSLRQSQAQGVDMGCLNWLDS
jgi:hypothetical protein